jgi:hypothetical protein
MGALPCHKTPSRSSKKSSNADSENGTASAPSAVGAEISAPFIGAPSSAALPTLLVSVAVVLIVAAAVLIVVEAAAVTAIEISAPAISVSATEVKSSPAVGPITSTHGDKVNFVGEPSPIPAAATAA